MSFYLKTFYTLILKNISLEIYCSVIIEKTKRLVLNFLNFVSFDKSLTLFVYF